MNVKTSQGEFEICTCGNPEGHSGPVWHPGFPHPSGAKLAKGEEKKLAPHLDPEKKAG